MTPWMTGCCLLAWTVAGSESTIDTFNYTHPDRASKVWRVVAERGSEIPLRIVAEQGRNVLELPTPFQSQPDIPRFFMDRDVALNLAAAGELSLEVLNTNPTAGGRLSLYFRSGKGWYTAGAELAGRDWQTLRFSKAAFSLEGTPTGWHQIDGVRIAVWRGQPRNSSIRLRRLATAEHDVAIIIPTGKPGGDLQTSRQTSNDVAEMLSELGLGSDAIEETAMTHGGLGDRRVAILAFHPSLPKASTEALVKFIEQGGKLLVCYQLPTRLGAALGFTQSKYFRPDDAETLAEVRFDPNGIDGLPASMRQASWNITTAQPAGFNARIIGYWYRQDGQSTGHPAMLLSDRGAFFSHIILRDDRENKKQMLAAVLGHLAPPLWKQMADNGLELSGHVGHLENPTQLAAFLRESKDTHVAALLASAEQTRRESHRKENSGAYAQVVTLAGRIRKDLRRAYLLAQPSTSVEGRAYWNHTGTGAYAGDWERTARELNEAGFNMVMPNMLWGGRAHYPSDVLPRSTTYEKHGDQIAQCVAAAKKHGLEVHVWKVNWNLSGAPRAFVQRIHREHRNQVSVDGKPHDWLCPSHPDNFQLELASMLEVARKYPVDGLHFDYIRYPGRDSCYCEGCRERFQTQSGNQVGNWPNDCYSGEFREAYATWRCDQITRLVKAVRERAKEVRPEIAISAAVFGNYPSCRSSVAQDWPQWVQAGYLDFVCPMDYTQNDQAFINLVTNQLRLVDGRIPVYPGIGQWRLTEDRTVGQIHHARQLGAAGFTLFDLSAESIQSAVPAVGMGVGRQRAATPHGK